EAKGVKVSSVRLEQASGGGLIVPSYSTLGSLSASILLVYLLVGRSLLGFATLRWARLWALLAAAMAGLGATWSLAQSHVAVSAAGVHLAVTTGSALLILIVCERLLAGGGRLASSRG